eukprot:GHUV01053184.1.p1 GENE.GHUV01053184.1~~GHUV01053184.1.p1  ORF type:complete len:128 (+),score=22.19 GHUV01053184.1:101-484(+)
MGAVLAFVGRCMLASLFVLSGCMKFSSHAEPGGGPVVKYMEPKLDYLQEQVHHHTGFHLPLERDAYPLIALTAGVLEVVGGGLFVFNSSLGALLLVSETTYSNGGHLQPTCMCVSPPGPAANTNIDA